MRVILPTNQLSGHAGAVHGVLVRIARITASNMVSANEVSRLSTGCCNNASTAPVPAAWIRPTAWGSGTARSPDSASRRTRASRHAGARGGSGRPCEASGGAEQDVKVRVGNPKSMWDRHARRSSTGSPSSRDATSAFAATYVAITCSATASIRPSLSPNFQKIVGAGTPATFATGRVGTALTQ